MGSKALNLLRRQVEYAISKTRCNTEAARFLGVSYSTWKKYAAMYIDEETGLTLLQLHSNKGGKGIPRKSLAYSVGNGKTTPLLEILEGKHPNYSPRELKKRIISHNIIPERCSLCGFEERRITDGKVPLLMEYIDGDRRNHKIENLRFLCYNCYYLNVDNIMGVGIDSAIRHKRLKTVDTRPTVRDMLTVGNPRKRGDKTATLDPELYKIKPEKDDDSSE